MSWLLLFTRFLLASTSRTDDGDPTTFKELMCRMFGEVGGGTKLAGADLKACQAWAQQGCGCPIEIDRAFPEASPGDWKVGWEEPNEGDLSVDTRLTFSFEKEWLGHAPLLHKLYEPAGEHCERLWPNLGDKEKAKFMQRFYELHSVEGEWHPNLKKYFDHRTSETPCGLWSDDEMHFYLPLRRHSDIPELNTDISGLLEADRGPWEIKADSFFYDLGKMSEVVRSIMPYVNVPAQGGPGTAAAPHGAAAVPKHHSAADPKHHDARAASHGAAAAPHGAAADRKHHDAGAASHGAAAAPHGAAADPKHHDAGAASHGFPAERRIQLHVVAPIREAAYPNENLRRSFRLLQLYFADYMLFRLAFPNGPKGNMCNGVGGKFNCDVFTDFYNNPTDARTAATAARESQPEKTAPSRIKNTDDEKFLIVGLRGSGTYSDTDWPQRVGFEIRKSESFGHAVYTAEAIANALSSMRLDGSGSVRIHRSEAVRIAAVQDFAANHRLKLSETSEAAFCFGGNFGRRRQDIWDTVVHELAMYLYVQVGQKQKPPERLLRSDPPGHTIRGLREKLDLTLRLLLCSDWTQLLGDISTDPTRDQIMQAFVGLKDEKAAMQAGTPPSQLHGQMEVFRRLAADYAYQMSNYF